MTDTKEEVVGIILLVLAIAAIFIPLALIIGKVFLTNQETANAQKTIDTLMIKISDLKAGEGNDFTVQGFYGAENWYLVGWSKDESGRPDKCFFKNGCLCLCKYTSDAYPTRVTLSQSCQDNGFCKDASSTKIVVYDDYSNLDSQYSKLSLCYVLLKSKLLSLSIQKDNDNSLIIKNYLTSADAEADRGRYLSGPSILSAYRCPSV